MQNSSRFAFLVPNFADQVMQNSNLFLCRYSVCFIYVFPKLLMVLYAPVLAYLAVEFINDFWPAECWAACWSSLREGGI